MARAQRKEKPSLNDQGLQEPFPAAPHRHSRYGFYVHDHRSDPPRFMFQNFVADYAASIFLETVIDGDKYIFEPAGKYHPDRELLRTSRGITIREEFAGQLEQAIEYKPTPKEAEWDPNPSMKQWRNFVNPPTHQEVEADNMRRTKTQQAANTAKPKRTPKTPGKPKAMPPGMISIAAICEELKIEPRIARGILRDSTLTKPEHGWAFTKEEVENVKKIIKKGMKK